MKSISVATNDSTIVHDVAEGIGIVTEREDLCERTSSGMEETYAGLMIGCLNFCRCPSCC